MSSSPDYPISTRFRWASLQLEILCTPKLDADVRATLGRLPPKLEQLYLEIYEKQISRYHGEAGRSIINNILKWLLHAQTRMSSSELCAAVAMNIAVAPEDLTKEHILDLCHNFVVFDDGLDTFRFAHLSVREFLETRDEFSPIHCHLLAAEVCLLQLIGSTNSSIAEKFLKDECAINVVGKTASAAESLPEGLQNYATIHWSLHCSRIGERGRESQTRFKRLFQFFLSTDLEGPSPLDAWLLSYRHRDYSDEAPYSLRVALDTYHSPLIMPLFLASAFGFCEVIRTCLMNPKLGLGERRTAWSISSSASQGEALRTHLENRGDCEIPESIVPRVAMWMDADEFAWLLDQVPNMKYTASFVASMKRRLPETRKENVDILLHHFGFEKASNEILKVLAPNVTVNTFRTLLGRPDEELVSGEVFEGAASCQNVEVMTILVEQTGFHLTPAAMAAAARACNFQTMQLLLDRGGDTNITGSVMQQAAKNEDEKVISLLLDHGGVISLDTMILASALGYAKVLRCLLQRGEAETRSMLRAGAQNHRDGGAVMTLLLAEVKHEMVMEELNELMKQAARNFNYAFEIITQLLAQYENITVTEDVLMAAASNACIGGPLLCLLLKNVMKKTLTIEVLEAFLSTLTSYDMIQPLLDRIGETSAGERLLEAAARNPLFGDELIRLLLETIQVSELSNSVWSAAVANQGCGVEIVKLLESRFGKIIITEATMMTAASEGMPRTMAFLLNRTSNEMITEDVLLSAPGRITLYSDEMMIFLLEKAIDVPMTERLVNRAARYCSVNHCLPLIWARSGQSKISPALAQAAAENYENFKFLLDETGDVEIGEEVLETIVNKNCHAIETLTMLLDRSIHFSITPKVLIKAAGNVEEPGPLVTYLLKHSNDVSVTDDVFLSTAASGNDEVLLILSRHCAMDKVPVMWAQISQLYRAAATEIPNYSHPFSYWQQSYNEKGFEQDACIEEVRYLLGQGVEPDLPDQQGLTPLALAAERGNELIFKALLDAGANPCSKDQFGRTPLFGAAAGGNYEIVETLLGMGVKVDLKDENDITPGDEARKNAHMRVFRLLEKHSKRGRPPSELSLGGLELERA